MAKISKHDLRKRLQSGDWRVSKVEKAKPKPKPKKLLKEQVAEEFATSSNKTQEAITQLADAIRIAFDSQSKVTDSLEKRVTEVGDRKIIVEMPPSKASKKKSWKFTVQRDHRGFIENIIADEI